MLIPWCEVQICQELPLGWLQAAFVSVKSVQTSGPRELTQRRICDPQGFLRRLWAEWGQGGGVGEQQGTCSHEVCAGVGKLTSKGQERLSAGEDGV